MKTQKEQKEKENRTGDKMILRLKEETVNEIFKNENNKEKKAKPHIFDNKKNNNEFPNLLRLAINTVKRIISYAISKRKTKEKQNIK